MINEYVLKIPKMPWVKDMQFFEKYKWIKRNMSWLILIFKTSKNSIYIKCVLKKISEKNENFQKDRNETMTINIKKNEKIGAFFEN